MQMISKICDMYAQELQNYVSNITLELRSKSWVKFK